MNKATVIGTGNLGSCIAYEIANRGLVDEIVLIDIYGELVEGNAADIAQAMALRRNVNVVAGDYKDIDGSKVIVVTAGKPRTPDMKSRMELLRTNAKIIANVASSLKRVKGNPVIVTLTNPVDVMNYVMWKNTGFNRRKVLGSAGMLDSARFRTVLAKRLGAQPNNIEAYVIGEHGANQVPVFSRAKIKGQKIRFTREERLQILEELRQSALEVISKKGATIFAPANNTVNMIQMIMKDEKKTAVCSTVLNGEYGLNGLSIGVPVVLGGNGVEKILEWDLDKEEKAAFYNGAKNLKEAVKTMGE